MSDAAAADDAKAGNDNAFFLGVELRSGGSSRSRPGSGGGRLERERIDGRNADNDEDGGGEPHFCCFFV